MKKALMFSRSFMFERWLRRIQLKKGVLAKDEYKEFIHEAPRWYKLLRARKKDLKISSMDKKALKRLVTENKVLLKERFRKHFPVRTPEKLYNEAFKNLVEARRFRKEALDKLKRRYNIHTGLYEGERPFSIISVFVPENLSKFQIRDAFMEADKALKKYRVLLQRARARIIELELSYELVENPSQIERIIKRNFGKEFFEKVERFSRNKKYVERLDRFIAELDNLWSLVVAQSKGAFELEAIRDKLAELAGAN